MSRAKYLALMSWLGRSPAVRRMAIILPLIVAATTAEAPLARSALRKNVPDTPAAGQTQTAPTVPDDREPSPDQISLLHYNPTGWSAKSAAALRDPIVSQPTPPWRDFQPPAAPDNSIAITDPQPPQPLIEPNSPEAGNSGLLSRAGNEPNVGVVVTDIPPDDPTSFGGGGNGSGGGGGDTTDSPTVGTPVPEPVSLWLLPASVVLLHRRKPSRV